MEGDRERDARALRYDQAEERGRGLGRWAECQSPLNESLYGMSEPRCHGSDRGHRKAPRCRGAGRLQLYPRAAARRRRPRPDMRAAGRGGAECGRGASDGASGGARAGRGRGGDWDGGSRKRRGGRGVGGAGSGRGGGRQLGGRPLRHDQVGARGSGM